MNRSILFAATSTALDVDLRSAAASARQLRVEGLLVPAYSPALDLTALSQTGRRELRHVIASHDLRWLGLQHDLGAKGLLVPHTDRVLSRALAALEAAAGLRADVLTIDLGPIPAASRAVAPKPKVTAEMAGLIILPTPTAPDPEPEPAAPRPGDAALAATVAGFLGELARAADRHGVRVALRSTLASFASIDAAVTPVNCPWFGLDFDLAATVRDAWPVDELLSRFAGRVWHARARDAIAGEAGRTKPAIVGRGDVKWREALQLLDDAGYQGALTLDPTDLPDPAAATRAGLAQLRAIVG
jgi:sugar phosphate isomerase/epimerase